VFYFRNRFSGRNERAINHIGCGRHHRVTFGRAVN
jgi:hypothetical protein